VNDVGKKLVRGGTKTELKRSVGASGFPFLQRGWRCLAGPERT
jgi:hypothetical protein